MIAPSIQRLVNYSIINTQANRFGLQSGKFERGYGRPNLSLQACLLGQNPVHIPLCSSQIAHDHLGQDVDLPNLAILTKTIRLISSRCIKASDGASPGLFRAPQH